MHMDLDITSIAVACVDAMNLDGSSSLGSATGFFAEYKERTYLITCWHVATGRNFQTKKPIRGDAALPGYLVLDAWAIRYSDEKKETFDGMKVPSFAVIDVNEERVDLSGHTHPQFGTDVDVVAFDVSSERELLRKDGFDLHSFNLSDIADDGEVKVMDQVFIPGYPNLKVSPPNDLPIYKAGSIASEPHLASNAPFVFVDGKTKKGWSGSPVIHQRPASLAKPESGFFIHGIKRRLYAVYSGRDENDKELAQAELAYIWPLRSCLLPILEAMH